MYYIKIKILYLVGLTNKTTMHSFSCIFIGSINDFHFIFFILVTSHLHRLFFLYKSIVLSTSTSSSTISSRYSILRSYLIILSKRHSQLIRSNSNLISKSFFIKSSLKVCFQMPSTFFTTHKCLNSVFCCMNLGESLSLSNRREMLSIILLPK